jgi:hypothetical protein
VINQQPIGATVFSGGSASFAVGVTSSPAATYQWFFNGAPISGATLDTFSVSPAAPNQAGAYGVVATNPAGSVTSDAATLVVNPDQRLVNLSARAQVGTGDNVAISGFVIDGSAPRPILVRAVGPGLAQSGLTGLLAHPVLSIYSGATLVATNAGWDNASNSSAIASTAVSLGAFALPTGSADSALLLTLNPGAYTAVVSGQNATVGLALVEVYDTAQAPPGLVNVSGRGTVGDGDKVFITGFVLAGNTPRKVMIRAVGPTLTSLGVTGAVADPKLQLYQGATLLATVDNWNDDAALQTASAQAGAFPLAAGSKDAALLTTLASGGYTIVVSGVGGSTGVVLVEIYEMP